MSANNQHKGISPWKALLGGVVSIAMIVGTNTMVANASPAAATADDAAASQPTDGNTQGSEDSSAATSDKTSGTTADNAAQQNAASGKTTGESGKATSDNTAGKSADAERSNAASPSDAAKSGTPAQADDAGLPGAPTVPTTATLTGDSVTATIKNGTKNVAYTLVNDAWGVSLSGATNAARLRITGYYSVDGSVDCVAGTTSSKVLNDPSKCRQLDQTIIVDANGNATWTPQANDDNGVQVSVDGVFDLNELSVRAYDADLTASQPAKLAAIAGTDRLVVDTNASQQTTLSADVQKVNASSDVIAKPKSFTISSTNPLFALRMKVLKAYKGDKAAPLMLTIGENQHFGDVAEATSKKVNGTTTYSVTVDAKDAPVDAFAKDGTYKVSLNPAAFGKLGAASATSVSLRIDNSAPKAPTAATVATAADEAILDGTLGEDTVRMLTGAHDLVLDPADDVAAVDHATVTLYMDGGKTPTTIKGEPATTGANAGKIVVSLPADHDYDLTKSTVTVTDEAGRSSKAQTLAGYFAGDGGFTHLLLDKQTPDTITVIPLHGRKTANGIYNSINGIKFVGADGKTALAGNAKKRMQLIAGLGATPAVHIDTQRGSAPEKTDYTTADIDGKFELNFEKKLETGQYLLKLAPELTKYLPSVNDDQLADPFNTDTTSPVISGVTFTKSADKQGSLDLDGGKLYVNRNGGLRFAITTTDKNTDGSEGTGVETVTLTVPFAALNDDGTIGTFSGTAKEATITATKQADGTFAATLPAAGVYDFATASATATDYAGNVSAAYKFADHTGDAGAFGYIQVFNSASASLGDDLKVTIHGVPAKAVSIMPAITITGASAWFKPLVDAMKRTDGKLVVGHGTVTAEAAAAKATYDLTVTGAVDAKRTVAIDGSTFSLTDGLHTLTLAEPFTAADAAPATFVYDTTAPQVTDIKYSTNGGEDVPVSDTEVVTGDGPTSRTFTFTVKDYLPGTESEANTSGVAGLTVTYAGDALDVTDNHDGTYSITLDKANTSYDLSKFTVTATDKVGKSSEQTLAELLAAHPVEELKGIETITVSDAEAERNVTTTLQIDGVDYDAAGSANGAYLNLKDGTAPKFQLKVTAGKASFTKHWDSLRHSDASKAIPVLVSTRESTGSDTYAGSCLLDTSKPAADLLKDGSYLIPCSADASLINATQGGRYTITINVDKLDKRLKNLIGHRDETGKFVVDQLKTLTVGVDNVAPTFVTLAHTGQESDLKGTTDGGETVLSTGSQTLTFDVHDLFAAPEDGDGYADAVKGKTADDANVSGLDKDSIVMEVGYTQFGKDKATKADVPVSCTADGSCTATLSAEGIYTLAGITVKASDKAQKLVDGKVQANANVRTVTLDKLKSNLKADVPDEIVISNPKAKADIQVNGAKVERYYGADIESVSLKVSDDPAFAIRAQILKSGYKNVDVFTGSRLQYAETTVNFTDDHVSGLTFGNAAYDDKAGTISWSNADGATTLNTLFAPLKNGGQTNGEYTLATNLQHGKAWLLAGVQNLDADPFILDTVAPQVTHVSGPKGDEGKTLVKGYSVAGKAYDIYAAAGSQQIDVTVKDLLPGEQTTLSRTSGQMDENGTAGIDPDTVTFDIPAPTDLDGKQLAKALTGQKATFKNGRFTITLAHEGFYDLSKITVSASDRATKPSSKRQLADYALADVKTADRDGLNYDAIVADVDNDSSVAVFIGDDSGKTSNKPGYFYRGTVTTAYQITDKWFPLYQKLTQVNGGNLLAGSVGNTSPQTGSATVNLTGVTVNDGEWTRGSGYTWTLDGQKVLLAGATREQEGKYDLRFAYSGLQTTPNDGSTYGKEFVLDWTAPKLGALSSNVTRPAKWNWIFATSGVTVTLDGVTDTVSGVCSPNAALADGAAGVQDACAATGNESVKFSALGFDNRIADAAAHPAPTAAYAGSTAAGRISFAFDGDSQRLTLGETAIALTDAAGNPVDTGALNKYDGVNGDSVSNNVKGVTGIAIDTVAPTLAIAYDNNDVRNGKYYKAHRTGTVTLVESNFDFSTKNEGGRVIVTTTVDGKKATVPVSAFSNPSGDRKTYVATFHADSDGDWTVEAGYTDPGDHAANAIRQEFVVDTIAPVLTMTFDNTSVRNGMYYNADRTASIKLVERNFSERESVVTTTAKDDAGAAQNAPGAAGWQRAGGSLNTTAWSNSVAFTGELHYTIKVNATDLAGNTAKEVSEPEFVIDKTKPQIKIDRVEDKTAYAGEVAPLIDYTDTNIDTKNISYTLTGAHRGQLKDKTMPESTTTDSNNKRVVDFKDFARKVAVDDVYTLTATATDMAGNEYKTSKTFSANRFGSTYTFTAGTKNLRGEYIKKSQDVQVTEINVSGLKAGKSQVVIAHNDNATTLKEAGAKQTTLKDGQYKVNEGADKGWSLTTYTIPAENFAADGYYRVQLQSVDNAGNLSQNTMNDKDADRKANAEVNFAVDSTAPTSSLLGVKSGSVYYDQGGRSVSVDAKDNLGVDTTELYADGQLIKSWKGADVLKVTPTTMLDADAASHEYTVRTVDLAGNESTATYDNVYIASNWWQYATHTPWIVNTMIFSVIILLALIAAAVIAFQQRRKRLAYRKSVLGKE
ncbi:Ig-like domain-containing protein [Bifidobacterium leontopitheci]|uniref:Uncharacterized protein n=1 Tax=Bifidobacterium leontopitheci TaxID=2650774 RepID=A0A6I1GLD6_9BIFI|nr:hypothetical protein [Bifidobacterium leontopitheci]KAB7790187.1 hypothetical protein F7D09_1323 [Bifidobacterium leontopitheci]